MGLRNTPRERCAELLQACLQERYPGIEVTVDDLWTRSGGEYKLDITRWGAQLTHKRYSFTVCCWDTMTECAREGLVVVDWPQSFILEVSVP